MPQENLEEEGLPKNPDLQLAQSVFLLTTNEYKHDASINKKIMDKVIEDNMAPFYETVCVAQLGFKMNENLLKKMKETNENDLKAIDEKIMDAEQHLGDTDVRDFRREKAAYLSKIGDKEAALVQFQKISDNTLPLGYDLDLVFHRIRIGLFYMDHDLITRCLEKAQSLIDQGGDWDRRNRLKVYRGVYCMSIREFKKAANLFLDTVATFTSYELMDYQTFVTYTVFCCAIALQRPKLRKQVIKGSEILEVLHSLPNVKSFLFSLYDCDYAAFFKILAWVEKKMQYDRLLSLHYRYYIREMRIVAYSQLLESYRSLTLACMAETFGVTSKFIDQELSRFIAAGRLHCKIDKVAGVVVTNRPDSKNSQYQDTIKQGDNLLNRVQKLSRIINI